MAGHGGKRNGSGRKEGGANKKTSDRARKAASEGMDPVEVMLFVMRKLFAEEKYSEAASIAKDAAPYCAPRLGQVTLKGDPESPVCVVEELVVVDGNTNATPQDSPGTAGVPA